jgi:ABC-type nitrate/sulfonate/bicarbonate transport system substrate-binding protein
MINPPFSFSVLDKGLKSLGSHFDLLGPYQATGAFVMRPWAVLHADVLTRYLAAYIEGQRYVLNPANRHEMVALLVTRFKLSQQVADGTYDALVKPGSGLAPDAGFNEVGFNTVLAIRAEMEGMWGGTPPAPGKYLDLTYHDAAIVGL